MDQSINLNGIDYEESKNPKYILKRCSIVAQYIVVAIACIMPQSFANLLNDIGIYYSYLI